MTPDEIAALRALVDAATPGPWTTKGPGRGWGDHVAVLSPDDDGPAVALAWASREWKRDAAFIAASRAAVPTLLDEVERLRGALRECVGQMACAAMFVQSREKAHSDGVALYLDAMSNARRVLGEAGKEEGR